MSLLTALRRIRSEWQAWRSQARERKRARAIIDRELFAVDAVLARCSLRADQRGRADIVEWYCDASGEMTTVWFTMLRHPRPYAFSKQFHEVLELYRFDRATGEVRVERSVNLTRSRGRDGEGTI